MPRQPLVAGALTAAAISSLAAFASGQEVYIFGVEAEEGLSTQAEALSAVIGEATDATRSASLVITHAPQATVLDTSLLLGCSALTPDCLTEMAETLEVDRLIYGSLAADGDGQVLRLHSFDAASQTVAAYAWNSSDAPLPDVIRTDLPVFLDNRAILSIESPIQGALTINGIPAGSAPHRVVGAELGIYDIEVVPLEGPPLYGIAYCEQPNYCETEVSVDFQPDRGVSDAWYWIGGGGALLTAAAGFGILTARTRQEARFEPDDYEAQRKDDLANRLQIATYILLGSGAVFSTYGGYQLYQDRRADRQLTATVAPAFGVGVVGTTLTITY